MNIPPPAPEGGWPWAKAYAAGMVPDASLPLFTVHSIADESARRWPERPAINFRGRDITYDRLARMTDNMAAALRATGVSRGDRLALLLPNTPAHPIAFFGILKAGAIAVHASPLDAPRILGHKLADSGARTLITTNLGALAGAAAEILATGAIERLIVVDDTMWGESAETGDIPAGRGIAVLHELETQPPVKDLPDPLTIDDVALLQYTGGTTGLPKAAMLSHRNLSSSVSSYEAWYDGWKLNTGEAEKILLYLPLFHIYGLSTVMLRALAAGHTLLLRTKFDPAAALDEIEAGASVLPGVPTMWIAICATPGFEKRNLSSLTIAASGGAPIPIEVARRFRAETGIELVGGWGMSELAPAGTNLPRGRADKQGSIGIPLPGVFVKVVALDDPRRELGANETGELAVCGHNVTSGYWNRPEDNALCFVDGWFLTGDIGYRDEDGFFFIVDRKKDMIISGGFNVYPQMIEQAIYEHPGVEEVLVIGVPDRYRGESAKAFVKLRNGAKTLTLDALTAFLQTRLGRHEMPRALELRPALPRTPVGKLSKIDLKREEAEKDACFRNSGT